MIGAKIFRHSSARWGGSDRLLGGKYGRFGSRYLPWPRKLPKLLETKTGGY